MSANTAYLEMIQAVVNRLAANSYAYKGWAITVAAGLIAFLIGRNSAFLLAGLYPILAFWILDAQSLATERAFRKLFDAARKGEVEDFCMNVAPYRRHFRDQVDVMLSGSMLLFYGSAAVCIIVVAKVSK